MTSNPEILAEDGDRLFRLQALHARGTRIDGEVIIPHSASLRILSLVLFGVVALLSLWIALGTYTRSEIARGMLVTQEPSVKVVAIRPGLISRLGVQEGDRVLAGQVIAVVRTDQLNELGGSPVTEALAEIDRQTELTAQQSMLMQRRAIAERERLTATQAGIREQQVDLAAQITLQEEAATSARDVFERIAGLLDQGFISRFEVERRRQAHIVARQELARLHQQRGALQAELNRTAAELRRSAADAEVELVSAQTSTATLAQQRSRSHGERAYSITAPISGRVTAIQSAAGRTADPNVPLLEILPENSVLRARIYAPTRAIGFVRVGQEVRLLYDAFPYQRFGSFNGRVVQISRTVIDPRQLASPLGIDEPVYAIDVLPDAQVVTPFGERHELQSGMTLTANLILDRRSFLDWLLSPLRAVLRRNGEA